MQYHINHHSDVTLSYSGHIVITLRCDVYITLTVYQYYTDITLT